MIAFLVTHPWMILATWIALCAFLVGIWIGAVVVAEKRRKRHLLIVRQQEAPFDFDWPERWSPTKAQSHPHLGKTNVGRKAV